METVDYLDVRIEGEEKGQSISPETIDVAHLDFVLQQAVNLFYPDLPESERPVITAQILSGSAKVRLRTLAAGLLFASAHLQALAESEDQDLEPVGRKFGEVIKQFQAQASKRKISYSFEMPKAEIYLRVSNSTHWSFKNEDLLVADELYLTGIIVEMGGTHRPNIHVRTQNNQTLIISAEKESISNISVHLYTQKISMRVSCKLNLATGEHVRDSFKLIEIVNSRPYSKEEMDALVRAGTQAWSHIDTEAFLNDIRYGNDE